MTDPQTTELRAVAYERVSRSGGRNAAELERTTLREQRELYERALHTLPSATIVKRLCDVDQSGASSSRPALDELWRLVDARAVDVVIVGYLSRFGRSASQVLANVERLKAAGIVFVSARERVVVDPAAPDPYALLLLAVLAAIAEIERERLREGLASANANAIDDGRSIAVPYGYKRENGSGSPLELDDIADEHTGPLSPAAVVALIFERRLDDVGASAIAAELNELEIPPPTALAYARGERKSRATASWRHNTVRGIVETHTYKGVIPRWSYEGTGKRRKRIDDSLELLPAAHRPLVSDDDWRRAQFSGTRAVRNGKSTGALLEGLVRCASCSQTMRPSIGSRDQLLYTCKGRARGCQRPARIARHLVDEYVLSEVDRALERGMWGRRIADRGALEQRLGAVDARVEHAKAELDAFIESASPLELGANFAPLSRRFRAAYDVALRERDELLRELEQTSDELTLELWRSSMPSAERRERLRDGLDAVVVLPAPGQGRSGVVDERVHLIVDSPIELGRTGRIVANRPFPLDPN